MSFDFGAAMKGLAGGMSIGKTAQGAGLLGGLAGDKAASGAKSGDKVGFGLGQSLVSGDAGTSEIATPAADNTGWTALSKIMETLSGGQKPSGVDGQAVTGAGLGITNKITG